MKWAEYWADCTQRLREGALRWAAFCSLCGLLSGDVASARAQGLLNESPLPVVPLVAAGPGQKILIIADKTEAGGITACLRPLGITAEYIENYDNRRRDYSGYHAIVFGSNRMDHFEPVRNQAVEVFQPIVNFVSGGGHLVMFGTFHGRNMEHLQRFDIKATGGGDSSFTRIPGATEALIAGMEGVVPKDNQLEFLGRFIIARPYVPLFMRSNGVEPGLATTAFGDGRVTIVMVEPHHRKEYWLVQVVLNWHQRGAPSRLFEAGMRGLAKTAPTIKRLPLPTQELQESVRTAIQNDYVTDYKLVGPKNSAMTKELSRKLLHDALRETNPLRAYGMLAEAQDLTEKGGDGAGALNAIELAGGSYQIDVISALEDSLAKVAANSRLPGECRTVAYVSLIGAVEALSVGKLDEADNFLTTAATNGRRARAMEIPKILNVMKQKVAEARKPGGK